jgi:prepilin-type N-terminal cleavage/methylation domain-containing protein
VALKEGVVSTGTRTTRQRGLTLTEILIVVAVLALLVAGLAPGINRNQRRLEIASDGLMATFRLARSFAVERTRFYRVCFIQPGTYLIQLMDPADPDTWQVYARYTLEQDTQLLIGSGIPADNCARNAPLTGTAAQFEPRGTLVDPSTGGTADLLAVEIIRPDRFDALRPCADQLGSGCARLEVWPSGIVRRM